MFKRLKSIFRKQQPLMLDDPISKADIELLDSSLDMLRTSTSAVSEAAIDTARILSERLRYSEFRFMSTIDAVNDLFITKDGENRWTVVNAFTRRLLNIDKREYFGKSNKDLMIERPCYSKTLEGSEESDNTAWSMREPYRTDEVIQCNCNNGSELFYFDVVKTPIFNADGSRKELIVIGRDVTAIRERDKRMKACYTALNSASDSIAILNDDYRIFFCNDKFIEEFHSIDKEHCIGHNLNDIIANFTDYPEMINTICNNKNWHSLLHDQYDLTIIPVMNHVPDPIFYICTFKAQH